MRWRSSTLHTSPVTESRSEPSDAAQNHPMRTTYQPLRARPISRPLIGSPVLNGESVRRVVRSYFVSRWIYELTGARHALRRIRSHVETRSAPGLRSLGQSQPIQEFAWRFQDFVRAPLRHGRFLAQVAPARREG